MEEQVRRSFRVTGRVQGVGFRWWTRRVASGLGIAGWVRNDGDGSVVVHAVGYAAALQELQKVLRRGPMGARVDRVEPIEPAGVLQEGEFRIEA